MKLYKELIVALAFGVLIAMLGIGFASIVFRFFTNSGTAILDADDFEERVIKETVIQSLMHPRSPFTRPIRR